MSIESIGTHTIPAHALAALIDDDRSGLTGDDERLIDDWLTDELGEYTGLVFDIIGDEPEFATTPAFGLPCDCFGCEVSGHPPVSRLYETEEELSAAFELFAREQGLPYNDRQDHNGQHCDTRSAFGMWLDGLARDGSISDELAQGATI